MLADRLQHIFDDGTHVNVQPIDLPLALVDPLLPDVGVIPGIVGAGQLAHGMRPGLEEEAAVEQGVQRGRVIESGAGEHDEVVAAGDHADGVHLQQADAFNDAFEGGLVAAVRALMEPLLVDAEPLDVVAGDGDGLGHGGEFSMGQGIFTTEASLCAYVRSGNEKYFWNE